MREPISLKEILAVLIRKGTFLVVLAVIFGILLGSYQFVQQLEMAGLPENTPQQIENRYQEAMELWQQEKDDLQTRLEHAKARLAQQQDYCENSILMDVNPYDTAKCVMILSVTGLEVPAEQGTDSTEDRKAKMVTKIQEQYMLYWNFADLETELANHGYDRIQEKYHRESVRIEISSGGTLSIISLGKDAQTATKLAQTVYACMQTLKPQVEAGAYPHELTLLHTNTKMVVSMEIERAQDNAKNLRRTYAEEVEELQEQLAELEQPEKEAGYGFGQILKNTFLWIILGGIAGVFLGCLWLLVRLMTHNRAESSRQLEKLLQLPFLGSVARRGNIFGRIACTLLNERTWKDPKQASAYVAENLKALPTDKKALVILTTLPEEALGKTLKAAQTAAGEAFEQVLVVSDAEHNPMTARALSQCGCALLAERVGVSETQAILTLMDTAKRLDVPVAGFITL